MALVEIPPIPIDLTGDVDMSDVIDLTDDISDETSSRGSSVDEKVDVDAHALYKEFNEQIFSGRLPKDMKIVWKSRLKATAGTATWRKKDGVYTYFISLSIPLLQNQPDRLRRTLSHEMCHLAEMIIDGKNDMSHGKDFKKWAALSESLAGVPVTTYHDYQVHRPHTWSCACKKYTYRRAVKKCKYEGWRCKICDSRILYRGKNV